MTQENWKKKFNKDYRDFIKVVKVGQYDEKGVNIGFKESYNLIEDFISTLLAEERNKVLEEVEKGVEKKYETDYNMLDEPFRTNGLYNQALDDILKIINNLK